MCNIKSSICTQYSITFRTGGLLRTSFFICIFGLFFNNIRVCADDEITGRIFDKRGKPSKGVQIYVFNSDLKVTDEKGNVFSKNAINSTSSSRNGSYTISVATLKNITVIGKKKNLWLFRTTQTLSTTPLIDNLKECGNLTIYLH